MKNLMLFLFLPLISFSQITINDSDKKSSTKINSPKKEIIHSKEEVEQVQKAIEKLNRGVNIEVCDCIVVMQKTIDRNSMAEKALLFRCKKLARKYKVKTNSGLNKWYEDGEKGGCY